MTSKATFSSKFPISQIWYKLVLQGKGLEFINDRDKKITIRIDLTDKESPLKVDGSTASQNLMEYYALVARLQKKYLLPLEPKMQAAMKANDADQIAQVERQHQENLKLFVGELAEKINRMDASLSVFAIIRTLDFNKYLPAIENWHKTLVAKRPDSPFTTKLQQLIEEARRLRIGSLAPEIQLKKQSDGQLQRLTDLRGKVVLVDFWASWCLPCRKENLEFKQVFNEFEERGFVIWGISIDEDRTVWEKALAKDQLPWIQSLSIENLAGDLYNVSSLPTNFLIDTEGTIIARNLNAQELSDWLAENLK